MWDSVSIFSSHKELKLRNWPVTVFHRKMWQTNFFLKVTLSPDRIKSSLGPGIGVDQSWSNGNLHILTCLNIDPNVFHDGNVQMVQETDNEALTTWCTDTIVKGFTVNQELQTICQAVFGKGNRCPIIYNTPYLCTILKYYWLNYWHDSCKWRYKDVYTLYFIDN